MFFLYLCVFVSFYWHSLKTTNNFFTLQRNNDVDESVGGELLDQLGRSDRSSSVSFCILYLGGLAVYFLY